MLMARTTGLGYHQCFQWGGYENPTFVRAAGRQRVRLCTVNISVCTTFVRVNVQLLLAMEKSNRYKIEVKMEVNEKGMILTPMPRQWFYGLWANVYSANGYDYYLDPINLKIYDSKFKKWRAKWIRKLFYLLP